MPKSALLFGSIGAVAETSDIQRRAYNRALKEAGLVWEWNPDIYADLLLKVGGKDRIAELAQATGMRLSTAEIDAIHRRKTEIACAEIIERGVVPRSGVVQLLGVAKERGWKRAFVTTTYPVNIEAIFKGSGGTLSASDFDCIVTRDDVVRGKPAPDAYIHTLKRLGVGPTDALAIEDTASSLMSAKRAGIDVVATPGDLTAGQDFWQADLVIDQLADAEGRLDPRLMERLG